MEGKGEFSAERGKNEEEEEVGRQRLREEWRGDRNVKDVASQCRVAKREKEHHIALRSEEMRIKKIKNHNATAGTPNSIFPAAF